jgi:hypothetical protein
MFLISKTTFVSLTLKSTDLLNYIMALQLVGSLYRLTESTTCDCMKIRSFLYFKTKVTAR